MEKRSAIERTREARKVKHDTLQMLQMDPVMRSRSVFKRLQPVWEPTVNVLVTDSRKQDVGGNRTETTSFGSLINDISNERQKATAFEAELEHAVLLRDLASTMYQFPSDELQKMATFHNPSNITPKTDHTDGESAQDDEFWKLFAEVKQTAMTAREAGVRLEELAGGLDERVNKNVL